MRTIENPLRRKDGIDAIGERLDAGAQQFAEELHATAWPDDIRELCGDAHIQISDPFLQTSTTLTAQPLALAAKPFRINKAPFTVSAAATAAHKPSPAELRPISGMATLLDKLTTNAQLRKLEESKSQLPLLMSRAQACALMRTIENPLRRREALNVIADRLDAGAQQFANELTELTWPDDIRTLCGDPSILK